jgi:hypothetical protein
MTLAHDLLDQSDHLSKIDRNKPKQANLRRAVSSAYYALFHLLCDEAANRISPVKPPLLRKQIRRVLEHGKMRQACQAFAVSGVLVEPLHSLLSQPLSHEIRHIANTFVALQEARHQADYDITNDFTRLEVVQLCQRVHIAFDDWRRIRKTIEADVFLCALIFWKQWSR